MDTKRGFTLIELIIATVVVAITFTLFTAPIWNCFYTEEGVLKQLKAEGLVTENAKIVRTERCIFGYSKIYVRDDHSYQPSQNHRPRFNSYEPTQNFWMFKLDSNILYNYRFVGHSFPRPSHITAPRIP